MFKRWQSFPQDEGNAWPPECVSNCQMRVSEGCAGLCAAAPGVRDASPSYRAHSGDQEAPDRSARSAARSTAASACTSKVERGERGESVLWAARCLLAVSETRPVPLRAEPHEGRAVGEEPFEEGDGETVVKGELMACHRRPGRRKWGAESHLGRVRREVGGWATTHRSCWWSPMSKSCSAESPSDASTCASSTSAASSITMMRQPSRRTSD